MWVIFLSFNTIKIFNKLNHKCMVRVRLKLEYCIIMQLLDQIRYMQLRVGEVFAGLATYSQWTICQLPPTLGFQPPSLQIVETPSHSHILKNIWLNIYSSTYRKAKIVVCKSIMYSIFLFNYFQFVEFCHFISLSTSPQSLFSTPPNSFDLFKHRGSSPQGHFMK